MSFYTKKKMGGIYSNGEAIHGRCMVSCDYVGFVAQHSTCCLMIFAQAVIFCLFLGSSSIFVLLFGGIFETRFLQI